MLTKVVIAESNVFQFSRDSTSYRRSCDFKPSGPAAEAGGKDLIVIATSSFETFSGVNASVF